VRLAAKALPAAQYAVASSFSQPVRTGWADVLLNCFSPFAQEEFSRVLRPGGHMIYVVPGAEHLYQMKAVLYEKPYKNPVQQVEYPGFRAIDEREVQGTITVPAAQLEALFAMTPYYWKTPRDGAARLAALPQLTTTIAFRFLVFEKL
jgi:23S rRNA (guanine745-N1)-methyltransferase